MDWLKKLLEAANLTAEQVTAITKGVEGNYKDHVSKQKHDELIEAKEQLETQIGDRDKQLADLKKNVGDNDELKKQIETLQTENKQKDTDYQTKMRDLSVNAAIKLAVTGAAHDPEMIISLLDKTKIEVNEDGTIKAGLDDQLKALRESKAFLFVEKQKPKGWNPADGKPPGDGNGGSDAGDFGKKLAEVNNQNTKSLDEARQSYFG